MRQHLTRKTQRWLCVHDRGYTTHIVVMRGYILHLYRKGTVSLRRWFYVVIRLAVVIRPNSWLYDLFSPAAPAAYQETQEWLCVHDRGYTSHIVVMCGYTWLYTAYVPKSCHNLQTMVLRGYTIKAVVMRHSPWLYHSFFCQCISRLQGKPRGGYVSMVVVIRLTVVMRGYILHVYRKGPRTT